MTFPRTSRDLADLVLVGLLAAAPTTAVVLVALATVST
jgi:hypothetical protein